MLYRLKFNIKGVGCVGDRWRKMSSLEQICFGGLAIAGTALFVGGLVEATLTYTIYMDYKNHIKYVKDEKPSFYQFWIKTHRELIDTYRKGRFYD